MQLHVGFDGLIGTMVGLLGGWQPNVVSSLLKLNA